MYEINYRVIVFINSLWNRFLIKFSDININKKNKIDLSLVKVIINLKLSVKSLIPVNMIDIQS